MVTVQRTAMSETVGGWKVTCGTLGLSKGMCVPKAITVVEPTGASAVYTVVGRNHDNDAFDGWTYRGPAVGRAKQPTFVLVHDFGTEV